MADLEPLPDHFDWRDHNVITAVRDQGKCESCWAMAAVQIVESNYAIQYKNLTQYSVQQLVDCDYHDNRCWGGYYNDALHFLEEDQGLELVL